MHIPDGYLSPQTSIPLIAATVPFWMVALNKLKQEPVQKQIPLLALCSAFSFVIMMLNVPIGQSSVHAVGAVFIAVLLGPWAACIAVSMALVIQALIFGDGGILSIGANCFNMAVVMPFMGYYTYKLISGKASLPSKRSMLGVFFGSYIGLNMAALLTAIEFGIQPLLFKAADGNPLYGYYPLSVSVPVMMFEHTLIAGPIEGLVTVGAIGYIARLSPQLLNNSLPQTTNSYKPFIWGLITLAILTPVGLLASGTAWGEWGMGELKEQIGYIPKGLSELSGLWSAIIPNYSIPGLGSSFFHSSLGYIISAIVGIFLITLTTYLWSKLLTKERGEKDAK